MESHIFSSEHWLIFLGGTSFLSIIAHAVNTFPVPNNKYAAWLLSTIQFIVGQRVRAFEILNQVAKKEN